LETNDLKKCEVKVSTGRRNLKRSSTTELLKVEKKPRILEPQVATSSKAKSSSTKTNVRRQPARSAQTLRKGHSDGPSLKTEIANPPRGNKRPILTDLDQTNKAKPSSSDRNNVRRQPARSTQNLRKSHTEGSSVKTEIANPPRGNKRPILTDLDQTNKDKPSSSTRRNVQSQPARSTQTLHKSHTEGSSQKTEIAHPPRGKKRPILTDLDQLDDPEQQPRKRSTRAASKLTQAKNMSAGDMQRSDTIGTLVDENVSETHQDENKLQEDATNTFLEAKTLVNANTENENTLKGIKTLSGKSF
jgi:hypothetical protein